MLKGNHNFIEIHRLQLFPGCSREYSELGDYFRHPLSFSANDFQIVRMALGRQPLLHQLGITADGTERLADLVNNSRGHLTEGTHFGCLQQHGLTFFESEAHFIEGLRQILEFIPAGYRDLMTEFTVCNPHGPFFQYFDGDRPIPDGS